MYERQAKEKLLNAHRDRGIFRKRMQIINFVGLTAAFVVLIGALDRAYSPLAAIGLRFNAEVELIGQLLVVLLIVVIVFQVGTEIVFAERIIEAERLLARPSTHLPKNKLAKILETLRTIRT